MLMVVTDDRSTVGVTQDNLRTHIYELIDEEQAALEHLLVDEHSTLSLRCHNQEDRQQIGREAWPWSIGNGHNRAIDEALDAIVLLRRNKYIVTTLLEADTHACKLLGNDAEVVVRHILDGELRACHSCHTDEATHLNHIGKHGVLRATQRLHAVDNQQVRCDTRNLGTHAVEHLTQLLQVGLARSVVDGGATFGQYCRHDDVCSTRNRSLIQEHVCTLKALCLNGVELVADIEVEVCTELLEAEEVRIEAPTANLIATGLRHEAHAEAGQQRANHHHRATQLTATLVVVRRAQVVEVNLVGLQREVVIRQALHLYAHARHELHELHHIGDDRNIVQYHALLSQKRSAYNLKCLILCTLRSYLSL